MQILVHTPASWNSTVYTETKQAPDEYRHLFDQPGLGSRGCLACFWYLFGPVRIQSFHSQCIQPEAAGQETVEMVLGHVPAHL